MVLTGLIHCSVEALFVHLLTLVKHNGALLPYRKQTGCLFT